VVTNEDSSIDVFTLPDDFVTVKDALEKAGFTPKPQNPKTPKPQNPNST